MSASQDVVIVCCTCLAAGSPTEHDDSDSQCQFLDDYEEQACQILEAKKVKRTLKNNLSDASGFDDDEIGCLQPRTERLEADRQALRASTGSVTRNMSEASRLHIMTSQFCMR